MNQSTRLKMAREYYEHPLRKEYEAEKEKLHKKNPKRYLAYLVMVSPLIPMILIGILFTNSPFGIDYLFLLLGIGNLLLTPIVFSKGIIMLEEIKKSSDGISELRKRYELKGLYEMTENELLGSECGDLDRNDNWVCSATGEFLSYQDITWCRQKGNCKYCKKFVTAYLGDTEHWPHEFKR